MNTILNNQDEVTIGALTNYTEEDYGIIMNCENGCKKIYPYKEGAVRIIIHSNELNEHPSKNILPKKPAAFMFEEKEEQLCLTTLDLHLKIDKSPLHLTIYDRYENEVVKETTHGVFFDHTCYKFISVGETMEIKKHIHSGEEQWSDLYIIKSENRHFGLLFSAENTFEPLEHEPSVYKLSSKEGLLDYFVLTEYAIQKVIQET